MFPIKFDLIVLEAHDHDIKNRIITRVNAFGVFIPYLEDFITLH